MLSTAVALAILTTGSVVVIYSKLPRNIRRLVEKYSLITDLVCLVGVYLLLGGTLTALFAASMCGLVVSALLHIANFPNDYLYLYDMRNFIRDKLLEARTALNAYGEEYRERKLIDSEVG